VGSVSAGALILEEIESPIRTVSGIVVSVHLSRKIGAGSPTPFGR